LKLSTRYSQTIRSKDNLETLEKDPIAAIYRSNAAFKTMELNMAGKVIPRAFVILALIATAHLIRPFSVKNVTQHLIYSARSFRFALPSQLREKFDHADYLAINLSNSVFEANEGIRDFTRGMAADFAFRPMDVQPLGEVSKSTTKQEPAPKKSSPTRRINLTKGKESADPPIMSSLVAFTHSSEIMMFEMPPARFIEANDAPRVSLCPTQPIPVRINATAPILTIEATLTARKRDCEKREADQKTHDAWTEDAAGAKSSIWIVEKSGLRKINIPVSESEDQECETTAEQIQTESIRAEPVQPRTPKEQNADSPFSSFWKYPTDQQ
jgi:hypothetical protein